MASVLMRLASVATVMLATAAIATPVHAETCVNAMPAAARDVRGYTFQGEILSIRLGPVEEPGMPRASDVRIAISKVHANPTDRPLEEPLHHGQIIEIHSNACDGFMNVGVQAGSKALISTQSRYSASTWNTAVWNVEGSKLRLLVLVDSRSAEAWFTDDRRLAEVGSIGEAVALVASAADGMPDTATESISRSRVGSSLPVVIGLVGFALAWLGIQGRRSQRACE